MWLTLNNESGCRISFSDSLFFDSKMIKFSCDKWIWEVHVDAEQFVDCQKTRSTRTWWVFLVQWKSFMFLESAEFLFDSKSLLCYSGWAWMLHSAAGFPFSILYFFLEDDEFFRSQTNLRCSYRCWTLYRLPENDIDSNPMSSSCTSENLRVSGISWIRRWTFYITPEFKWLMLHTSSIARKRYWLEPEEFYFRCWAFFWQEIA